MPEPTWTDIASAISAVATPVIVAIFGWILTRRQSRSELLLNARIDYYRQLGPELNKLMSYMMFIGTWRDIEPLEVIALKRRLDASFYVAAPLYSRPVTAAYENYMKLCFLPFGDWGSDALIRSSPYRRRLNWKATAPWDPSWGRLFELREEEPIERQTLEELRSAYDLLISALVTDLNINRARSEYTSARAVSNAGGQLRTVDGAPGRD